VPSPNPESDRPARKLTGAPLFFVRFFLCAFILVVFDTLFELKLDFASERPVGLLIMLPLGWAAAMVISAWLVGMIYYGKDDSSDEG